MQVQPTQLREVAESEDESLTPAITEQPSRLTVKQKCSEVSDTPVKRKCTSEDIQERKQLWSSIMSNLNDNQKELAKGRERRNKPNEIFAEYVAATLNVISDESIVTRVKLEIQLLLSKATIEAAESQLLRASKPAVQ